MADEKLPLLPSLTAITGQDLFYVVDVSDPTDDPTGSSKRITRDEILQNITGLTATTISATTYYNLPVDPNYYTTAFTYSNNVFTISQSGQSDLTATINSVTGLTINGNLTVTGDTSLQGVTATTISATTISATTYYGSGTNLTGVVKGSGTTNYLPKWTGTTNLGNSQIQDNSTGVGIGTAPLLNYRLNVYGALNVYSSLRVGLTTIGDAASIGAEIRGIDKGIVTNTQSDGGGIGITATAANDGGETQSGDYIGGLFSSSGGNGGTAYSVQLQDGTEGFNKVLVSKTSDGKANWTDPTTIQTAFNYGLANAIMTGNFLT